MEPCTEKATDLKIKLDACKSSRIPAGRSKNESSLQGIASNKGTTVILPAERVFGSVGADPQHALLLTSYPYFAVGVLHSAACCTPSQSHLTTQRLYATIQRNSGGQGNASCLVYHSTRVVIVNPTCSLCLISGKRAKLWQLPKWLRMPQYVCPGQKPSSVRLQEDTMVSLATTSGSPDANRPT